MLIIIAEISEKAFGPQHAKVAQGLYDLGRLYFKQKKFTEAEEYLRRSLVIREITLGLHYKWNCWNPQGEENPKLAVNLNLLGYIYSLRGEVEQAESLYQRCLKILSANLEADHPDLQHTRQQLLWIYFKKGDIDQVLLFVLPIEMMRRR